MPNERQNERGGGGKTTGKYDRASLLLKCNTALMTTQMFFTSTESTKMSRGRGEERETKHPPKKYEKQHNVEFSCSDLIIKILDLHY